MSGSCEVEVNVLTNPTSDGSILIARGPPFSDLGAGSQEADAGGSTSKIGSWSASAPKKDPCSLAQDFTPVAT